MRSPRKILRSHKAALASLSTGLSAKLRCPGSVGRPHAHTIIHHLLGDHHGSCGLLFSKLNNPISYNCLLPNGLYPLLYSSDPFKVSWFFLVWGLARVLGTESEQYSSCSIGCVPCPLCQMILLGMCPGQGASLESWGVPENSRQSAELWPPSLPPNSYGFSSQPANPSAGLPGRPILTFLKASGLTMVKVWCEDHLTRVTLGFFLKCRFLSSSQAHHYYSHSAL